MNKIVLTTFFTFSMFLCFQASAQSILLEELFDDSTLGDFTAYSVEGDDQVWSPREFNDKFFAQMNGFDGEIIDNEDWLISPAINMDLYSNEVLTFESASNFSGPELELLVSTDYDGSSDPNSATWTDLTSQASWSQGNYEYVQSGEIDLSPYNGTGHFAFKYTSTFVLDGKLWQIDSIVVKGNILNSTEDVENPELISNLVSNNGQLQFDVNNINTDVDFEIYSIGGVNIKNRQTNILNGTVSISINDLPQGMYVLSVRTDDYQKGYKFIR